MKRFIKFSMLAIAIFILFFIGFFLWGSSANLSEEESSKLTINNHDQDISNDTIHSIVTYNIRHLMGLPQDNSARNEMFYTTNFNNAATLLSAINPDIIAFQDIDFNAKRSYKKNQSEQFATLGYNYVAEAVYWDKKHIISPYWPISKQLGKVISGLAVISKFSIQEQQRIVLKNDVSMPFYKKKFYQDRIVQVVQLTINKNPVVIINVHLENSSKSVRTTQFKYVLDLFKKYSSTYPTILLGDFNSPVNEKNALIKQLFELDNIGYAAYKNLDYIFYNKNAIEIIESRVLEEFNAIANHVPVLMNFKLNKNI